MALQWRGVFSLDGQRPVRRPDATRSDLPLDLAFLPALCDVSETALTSAVARSACGRVTAAAALIASGAVSEPLYYHCLARHIGADYTAGWPTFAPDIDPREALRHGIVALAAPDLWLAAPVGRDLLTLLTARDHHGAFAARTLITTPTHFADVVRHRAGDAVARIAAEALPGVAPHLSAKRGIGKRFYAAAIAMVALSVLGVCIGSRPALDTFGLVFLAGITARILICAAGLRATAKPKIPIDDAEAPLYTVLVPLYREPGMIPGLVESLSAFDYPRAKVEVLILLEKDDHVTIQALQGICLPTNFRVIVAPDGKPRTKPRALNIGLMQARGELITVYDAEDRPQPDQLRKAATLFAEAPPDVACLQARLAIRNGDEAVLSSLFAIEYAGLFDLFNVGVARLGLPLALGGTSNHFRVSALEAVGAWDSWNVTEDADLGFRLARFGYRTQALDSTTAESAPTRLGIWFKQRRRWTKGWMQTLIVLARDPRASRDFGPMRSVCLALMLTSLVTGPLATPPFLLLLVWHLAASGLPHPQTTMALAEAVLAVSVFGLGAASILGIHLAAIRARGLQRFLPALPLMLPYALLVSFAAWGGLYDLIRNPFHWHKTEHGTGEPGAVMSSPSPRRPLRRRRAAATRLTSP